MHVHRRRVNLDTLGSGYRGIGCKVIPAIGALFFWTGMDSHTIENFGNKGISHREAIEKWSGRTWLQARAYARGGSGDENRMPSG